MVKQILHLLEQEIKNKACTMCTHYIKIDNISICNKHLVKQPFDTSSLSTTTVCKGKDFEVGYTNRFKVYEKLLTNGKWNTK